MRTAKALSLALFLLSRDSWLDDFHQLLGEMSSHYANLDSAIGDRRIDLPALRKRTEETIRAAKSDDEAKSTIEAFLNAFGDGHAGIEWAPAPPRSVPAVRRSSCERFGYKAIEPGGIAFGRLAEYHAIDDADAKDFPGGILQLSGERRVGIIRIRLFTASIHPELCAAAEKSLVCDKECDHRLELAVDDLATAALERRAESLRKAGAAAVVVDLTGNGGGSNWVEPAARVLTPVELKSPRLGFIRHPHWTKQLGERLDDVEHDLHEHDDPLLRKAESTLRAGIAFAKEPCDRGGVWNDPPSPPKCAFVNSELLFASGILPYAKPGSLANGWARNVLFLPSQFTYHEGANRLPLIVLVDQRTASAAETFAAMMQDNRAATIVGVPTAGSGCGHTNGGIWATLKNSGARVSLPDCVRLRADGTNEVVGIIPDVLVPWSPHDSAYQRAVKAVNAIRSASRASSGSPF
jgi:hypothetical protein